MAEGLTRRLTRPARLLAEREALRGNRLALAVTGVATGILAPVVVAAPLPPLVRVLVILAFACVGPGAAVLCHLNLGDTVAAWAVTLLVSLSVFSGVAVTMVWTKQWYPEPVFSVLGWGSAISCLIGLAGRAATAAAPPVAGPDPSVTTVMPRITDGERFDETSVIPVISDHTTVIPVISDQTAVIPAVPWEPGPTAGRGGADAGPAGPQAGGAQPGGAQAGGAQPGGAGPSGALTEGTGSRRSLREFLLDETMTFHPREPAPEVLPDTPLAGTGTGPGSIEMTSVLPRYVSEPEATAVLPRLFGTPDAPPAPRREDAAPPAPRPPKDADLTEVLTRLSRDPVSDTNIIPAIRAKITEKPNKAAWQTGGYATVAPARKPRSEWSGNTLIDVLIPLGAVAAWVVSLLRTDTVNADSYGLLFVMYPTFFVAIALCVLGFLREIAGGARRGWMLTGYLVLLVLIMHATVPALVPEPEYAWVYKHLGVIDYIRVHGSVDNSADIYQQWPTFFAGVAQLVTLSGMSALHVAAWAPPFFDMANALVVVAIARTLSTDRRVPYLAAFLFTCVNWIGQDYLSPQAFAYLLCLGLFLIMLRWLRRSSRPTRLRWKPLDRLRRWVQAGVPPVPYTTKRTRRVALFALYFVYAIVVVSHQISPYFVAAGATALVILGLLESWQVVPMFAGIAASFLLSRYNTVDHYGIFTGFSFLHSVKGVHGGLELAAAPGQAFGAKVAQSLSLTVWGATALTLFARRHRLGPIAVAGVLAFSPIVILVGQSYGGEVIYRVFLFSAPWCALLLAVSALEIRLQRVVRSLKVGVAAPVLALAVCASIQGEHGQLSFDQFSTNEVNGAIYLYDHVEAGAYVYAGQANMPGSLTARYADINYGATGLPALFGSGDDGTIALGATVDADDITAVDDFFSSLAVDGKPEYLVITASMQRYADFFGYLPPGSLDQVSRLLGTSPSWQVWYQNNDIKIFKYIPAPAA